MSNAITSDMYLSNQSKNRTPSPDLGKEEFLKILVTQLQNQDPLDPMEDKDFVAQMATFSSLEQQMNMAKTLEQLAISQTVSPVIQNSHMIGKEVSYIDGNVEEDEDAKVLVSEVVAVSQKDGEPILELANGEKIKADQVEKISAPEESEDSGDDDE